MLPVLVIALAVQAVAQDVTHTWAERYAGSVSTADDRGLGVAVLEDGMVITAGQREGAPNPLKGFVSFRRGVDGVEVWLETFADAPGGQAGAAVANAVAPGLGLAVSAPPGPPDPPVFSAGWFQRDVNFGSFGTTMVATGGSRDGFVTRMTKSIFGDPDRQTNWVFRCGGTGASEFLSVSCGPSATTGGLFGILSPEDPPGIRKVEVNMPFGSNFVAAGGYFTGQAIFGDSGKIVSSAGGEDAMVVLLKAGEIWNDSSGGMASGPISTMDIYNALTLGSTGSDRVRGIAVDQADQSVVVTGHFTGEVQFDPQGENSTETTALSAGGTDIFVARYLVIHEEQPPYYACKIKLDWLYTTGTTGNDSGASVAIDGFGHVYACGWRNGAGNKRDIWIAKIEETPDAPNRPDPNKVASAKWTRNYPDPPGDVGDDAAFSIALDGLDRVLVTGQFGKERAPGGNAQSHTLDFNPLAGVDNRTTAGGLDIFVTRLTPSGGYEWTFTLGGTSPTGGYNDVGAAIAVDPVVSTRIAHAGWFGHPDGGINNTYTLDFDPDIGADALATSGSADAFVSSFLPTMPESIKTQTTILLDNSTSVDFDEYAAYMPKLQTVLTSSLVVPHDGSAALNAVMFGVGDYPGWTQDTENCKQVMPWTVFTPQTASLFARKLASIPQPLGQGTILDEGLRTARRTLIDDRLTSCYRSIAVVADGCNNEDPTDSFPANPGPMAQARDEVVDGDLEPDVDQVNGLAVRGQVDQPEATRAYFLAYVVKAEKTVPTVDNWLGFASEAFPPPGESGFDDPLFDDLFSYLIRRSAHCPGDFDGNGVLDATVDRAAFIAASQADDPYADWNFDGVTDGDDVNGLDRILFEAALTLGCCP